MLIDFLKSDPSILRLVGRHSGKVNVISPVVDEVEQIDENELAEFGIIVIEPEIEDAYAASMKAGATSFEDTLGMLTAKRRSMIFVTNDRSLRAICQKEAVPIMWGLQLLTDLHKSGNLPLENAIEVAEKIHTSNPRHINKAILGRFVTLIRKQEDNL